MRINKKTSGNDKKRQHQESEEQDQILNAPGRNTKSKEEQKHKITVFEYFDAQFKDIQKQIETNKNKEPEINKHKIDKIDHFNH